MASEGKENGGANAMNVDGALISSGKRTSGSPGSVTPPKKPASKRQVCLVNKSDRADMGRSFDPTLQEMALGGSKKRAQLNFTSAKESGSTVDRSDGLLLSNLSHDLIDEEKIKELCGLRPPALNNQVATLNDFQRRCKDWSDIHKTMCAALKALHKREGKGAKQESGLKNRDTAAFSEQTAALETEVLRLQQGFNRTERELSEAREIAHFLERRLAEAEEKLLLAVATPANEAELTTAKEFLAQREAELEQERRGRKEESAAAAKRVSEMEDALQLEESNRSALQSLSDKLRMDVEEAMSAKDAAEETLAQIRGELQGVNAQRAALEADAAAFGAKVSLLAREKEIAEAEAGRLKAEQKIYDARMVDFESSQRALCDEREKFSRLARELELAQGKIKETEEEARLYKAQAGESTQQLESLKRDHTSLQQELTGLRGEYMCATREVEALTSARELERSDVTALHSQIAAHEESIGKLTQELKAAALEKETLEVSLANASAEGQALLKKNEMMHAELGIATANVSDVGRQMMQMRRRVDEVEELLVKKEQEVLQGEIMRKKMHNTIQELKGNVRVFCRVRPALSDAEAANSIGVIQIPEDGPGVPTDLRGRAIDVLGHASGHNELSQRPPTRYSFEFDKVFGGNASQTDVFGEIGQVVQSALDGFKVCIFAYGQTGSGKTHTMMGGPQDAGMIPLSLSMIFESIERLGPKGWVFALETSMLEIYNETIRDLLSDDREDYDNGKKHVIKHDAEGNTNVTDVTEVRVDSQAQVENVLAKAAAARSSASTKMNERSSRSHMIFILRIRGSNQTTGQTNNGVLNLIDLAGSERLARSGATGSRLKETQAINKSLSALGDVIASIAAKDTHVPYRNSKLTYLLQPCLGGSAKTLMLVNVAPDKQSASETICSLRFASKVNSCEVGNPTRDTKMK